MIVLFLVMALLPAGCATALGTVNGDDEMQENEAAPSPAPRPTFVPEDGGETASPLPQNANKIVSFTEEADLDGDGVLEKIEEGRYPLEGTSQGETFLHVYKGTELYSYQFDESEPMSYPEHVELQDFDGDAIPEILIFRDLGSGTGTGEVLKFQNNSFVSIFDTRTAELDIRVTYADDYQLLAESKTMEPTSIKSLLQPNEKFEGIYDEKGKLKTVYECFIDFPNSMYSVPGKENSPADIEVVRYCTGVGGHSADEVGIIRTVYRYGAESWEIISTTFTYTGI